MSSWSLPNEDWPDWRYRRRVARVTTTEGTPLAVSEGSLAVASGEVCRVRYGGFAFSGSTVRSFRTTEGFARRAAGGALEIVSAGAPEGAGDEAGESWGMFLDHAGNDLLVYVSGETSVTITWIVELEVWRVPL